MRSPAHRSADEAEAFHGNGRRAPVWTALLPLLFVLNVAAVALSLLAY
jgi:hypothetical protein